MKVAMVFPPWSPKEVFTGNLGMFVGGRWTPVGILCAAAAIRDAGHDVRFFDGGFMTPDELVTGLTKWGPDMVGAYLTTFLWKPMVPLARRLKQEKPARLPEPGVRSFLRSRQEEERYPGVCPYLFPGVGR